MVDNIHNKKPFNRTKDFDNLRNDIFKDKIIGDTNSELNKLIRAADKNSEANEQFRENVQSIDKGSFDKIDTLKKLNNAFK